MQVRGAHLALTLTTTVLRAVTVYVARRCGRFGGCYHGTKKSTSLTAHPIVPEPCATHHPTSQQLAAISCAQAASPNLGKRQRVEEGGSSSKGAADKPEVMDMDGLQR